MSQTENDRKYLMKSLDKALRVLDILGAHESLNLTEVGAFSGLDKTSAFKILYTLERRGFVIKTADARYRLGGKLVRDGQSAPVRKNIVDVSAPVIRALCETTGETISLAILNSIGRSINLYSDSGTSPDHVPARIGLEIDAYSAAVGKVLLAYTTPQMLQSIVQSMPFRAYTSATISSPAQLYQVLEEVRTMGYCMDSDERLMGRSSLAAPIFNHEEQCIASIALVCTTETFQEKREHFLQELLKGAETISVEMGHIPR